MPASPEFPAPHACLSLRDRATVLLLSLVVLLPGTFGVSLFDRDEGWYAQVSREMAASGDWIVPTYLRQPWLAKPPLLYWCVAGLFHLFGASGSVARLVPIAAMCGAVQILATLAASLYGRRVALFAAGAFMTAGLPIFIGRMLLTDALLLLLCLACIERLWCIAQRGATYDRCAAFWLLLGLASLAKGPAALVFVGAFVIALWVSPRALPERSPLVQKWVLLGRHFWLTLPVGVAVAAPWYVLASLRAGDTLGQQFFGFEIASRLVGTPHGHGGPPGYYVLIMLAGWIPWSVLLPGAVIEAVRDRRADARLRLLLVWFALPWIMLELIPSKLPHYILPCFAPLAILLGRVWDVVLQRPRTGGERRALILAMIIPLTLGLGCIVVAFVLYWIPARAPIAAIGLALVVAFAIAIRFALLDCPLAGWRTAVCGAVLFQWIFGFWLLPALEPHRLSRRAAEAADTHAGPSGRVYVLGYEEPTLFFYLQRPASLIAPDNLRAASERTSRPNVVLAREEDWRAAGIEPDPDEPRWHRVAGWNYVRGRHEVLWLRR